MKPEQRIDIYDLLDQKSAYVSTEVPAGYTPNEALELVALWEAHFSAPPKVVAAFRSIYQVLERECYERAIMEYELEQAKAESQTLKDEKRGREEKADRRRKSRNAGTS